MNSALKDHLQELLLGGSAHSETETILRNFPQPWIGEKPNGFTHSAWELLEHLLIAQSDILSYCVDPENHMSPTWPDEYWPKNASPENNEEWTRSVNRFVEDLSRMVQMVNDSNDLLAPLSPGNPHTLCREAMLLADHNAYHLGQIVLLKKYHE